MCSMKKKFDVKSDGTSRKIFLKTIMNFLKLLLVITLISILCKKIVKSRVPDDGLFKQSGRKRTCHCGYGGFCPGTYYDPKESCFCQELSRSILYEECEHCEKKNSCLIINHCERKPCTNGGTCFPLFGSFYCHCTEGYHGQTCLEKFGPEEKRKYTNDRR